MEPINERNFQSIAQVRKSTVSNRRQDRSKSKVFFKIDEAEEAEEMKQGQSTGQSMYGGSRGRQSRYTKVYNATGENAHERSLKITPAARKLLETIYDTLKTMFEKLGEALENVVPRNFRPCEEALEIMEQLHTHLDDFIKSLRYSPYEVELKNINNKIAMLIDELEVQPPFLLLRLVEFGFHIFEFGNWIREKLLPTSYAVLIHTIQTRIYVSRSFSLGTLITYRSNRRYTVINANFPDVSHSVPLISWQSLIPLRHRRRWGGKKERKHNIARQ
ncbi:unnamed protein product [Dibothriocephalus latus]|uniref:Uncharacterized protein n=1 Tax=Dibothriocephalus latus TaxID=60516 RepID=A0A3P6RX12_DIBLA|nr:unnamed protein product [Dibothriocephalus latus]